MSAKQSAAARAYLLAVVQGRVCKVCEIAAQHMDSRCLGCFRVWHGLREGRVYSRWLIGHEQRIGWRIR
jgi:hypothetical protein